MLTTKLFTGPKILKMRNINLKCALLHHLQHPYSKGRAFMPLVACAPPSWASRTFRYDPLPWSFDFWSETKKLFFLSVFCHRRGWVREASNVINRWENESSTNYKTQLREPVWGSRTGLKQQNWFEAAELVWDSRTGLRQQNWFETAEPVWGSRTGLRQQNWFEAVELVWGSKTSLRQQNRLKLRYVIIQKNLSV
jgi:hypothetical protein